MFSFESTTTNRAISRNHNNNNNKKKKIYYPTDLKKLIEEMVRAPCCEKMGLKKGPWTSEEDQILVNYIQQYGHGNWRALPKQAGLLRCGKSCRLRWINYLRPDIKRGNFSREEEDTIINLHEMLGNRWSAIAAKLPGRTDNEIKNVWHTHLKKRLKHHEEATAGPKAATKRRSKYYDQEAKSQVNSDSLEHRRPVSPQEYSSDMSSTVTIGDDNNDNVTCPKAESPGNFPEVDEDFWSEVLSTESSGGVMSDFSAVGDDPHELQVPFSPLMTMEPVNGYGSNMHDSMDFWFNVFTRAGEIPELPDF